MSESLNKLKNLSLEDKVAFFYRPMYQVRDIIFENGAVKANSGVFDVGIQWSRWDSACKIYGCKDLIGLPRLACRREIDEDSKLLLVRALRILLGVERTDKTFKDFL